MFATGLRQRFPAAWVPAGRLLTAAVLAIVVAAAASRQSRAPVEAATPQGAASGPRIEISFGAEARAEPVTGMVYVAISRDNQESPIEQAEPTGVPLFSKFV